MFVFCVCLGLVFWSVVGCFCCVFPWTGVCFRSLSVMFCLACCLLFWGLLVFVFGRLISVVRVLSLGLFFLRRFSICIVGVIVLFRGIGFLGVYCLSMVFLCWVSCVSVVPCCGIVGISCVGFSFLSGLFGFPFSFSGFVAHVFVRLGFLFGSCCCIPILRSISCVRLMWLV